MTPPTRFAVLASSALLVAVVACSPAGRGSPVGTPAASGAPVASAQASGTPGKPSPSIHIEQPPNGDAPSPVGQSETAWGRIWDRVPAWFPQYPGSAQALDAASLPVSGRFAVPHGDPRQIASWLQARLEDAQLSTDVSGPLEDGSMTLDSAREGGCRVRTTVTPLGGMTFIAVFYGSTCQL